MSVYEKRVIVYVCSNSTKNGISDEEIKSVIENALRHCSDTTGTVEQIAKTMET